MPRFAVLVPLLAAFALAGCTTATTGSEEKFKGTEADVAKVVADLQDAGQRQDAERICSQILAATLVDRLGSEGTSCTQEIDKATKDADDFGLEVLDVTVTGATATARVRNGADNRASTKNLRFVREANRWKVSELTGS
jgi:outer membrane PBP1 activator LpoA protein